MSNEKFFGLICTLLIMSIILVVGIEFFSVSLYSISFFIFGLPIIFGTVIFWLELFNIIIDFLTD